MRRCSVTSPRVIGGRGRRCSRTGGSIPEGRASRGGTSSHGSRRPAAVHHAPLPPLRERREDAARTIFFGQKLAFSPASWYSHSAFFLRAFWRKFASKSLSISFRVPLVLSSFAESWGPFAAAWPRGLGPANVLGTPLAMWRPRQSSCGSSKSCAAAPVDGLGPANAALAASATRADLLGRALGVGELGFCPDRRDRGEADVPSGRAFSMAGGGDSASSPEVSRRL
mmetsp:Transcript_43805/g.95363  ORF Transcript_43805/g.95363 Transcript_43805/m.95363 type:complete len:226 (-) Transcript_43805:1348-2025(-)